MLFVDRIIFTKPIVLNSVMVVTCLFVDFQIFLQVASEKGLFSVVFNLQVSLFYLL